MTVLPMIKPGDPSAMPPPLSPARAALADAIAALHGAVAAMETARKPVDRLTAVLAEAEAAEHELAAAIEDDRRLLGQWLARGSPGPRPAASAAVVAARRRIEDLAGDVLAAKSALPELEDEFQRAAEVVKERQRRRDEAVYEAAYAACQECKDELEIALRRFLETEALFESVEAELRRRGLAGDTAAGGAAERIRYLVQVVKRLTGVERNTTAGPRLLKQLVTDPAATL